MTYEQALAQLNLDQLAAVKSNARFLRIIAGPGSGKTQVLMTRAADLINEKKVSGHSIVCFTFTRKAANEMRERLAQFVHPSEAAKVTIGTFHAIAYRMIRQWHETLGYKSANISVLDEEDSLELLAYLARRHEPDEKKAKKLAKSAWQYLSESIIYEPYDDPTEEEESFIDLANDYKGALKQNNSVDYSGLIEKAKWLLDVHQERSAAYYTEQWKYILVDEFQDIDRSQMAMVHHLASRGASLAVVGDDDQSVYGFRGASPSFLIDFVKIFENVSTVVLRTNYRSYGEIVRAASRVIGHNEKRLPKALEASRGDFWGATPLLWVQDDFEKFIAGQIELRGQVDKLSDIAVLARTNYQLEPIAEALQGAGIPFQLISPYDCWRSKAVKRVIDVLKFYVNQFDDMATLRVLNHMEAFNPIEIGGFIVKSAEAGKSLFKTVCESEDERSLCFKKIEMLEDTLPTPASETIKVVAEMIIKPDDEAGHRHIREWLSQIPEGITNGTKSAHAFLQFIATRRIEDDIKEKENSVKLMTMHSAKGLEFSTVFIIGCYEGSIPQTKQDSDPEEERRVFYVGMTRARDTLCLLRPNTLQRYGKVVEVEASRFLKEMGNAN